MPKTKAKAKPIPIYVAIDDLEGRWLKRELALQQACKDVHTTQRQNAIIKADSP